MRRAARRDRNKVAVYFAETAWTYGRWNEEVNRLAHGFEECGILPHTHVGLVAANSLRFVTTLMALAKLGAVAVPMNPALTPNELGYIFADAGVAALVADAAHASGVDMALGVSIKGPKVVLDGSGDGWLSYENVSSHDGHEYWADIYDDDLAQILYTSGTESRPKGVMLTHRNLLDEFASILVAGEFRSDDTVLHALPLYHSAQLNAFFGPFLYLGATHVITERPDPVWILELIEECRVTEFFSPPTVWISMLRSPTFRPARLRSLQKAVYGAAIMPIEVLKELNAQLPWVRFWNMYGMTEVAPFATGLQPDQQLARPCSVGKPGINAEMAILRENGEEAPADEVGEIVFRTSHALLQQSRTDAGSHQGRSRCSSPRAGCPVSAGSRATRNPVPCERG